MEFPSRRAVLALLVCGGLGAALPAQAAGPEVKDQTGFFSADALQKANDELKAIHRLYHAEVHVETFATVPDNKADQVKAMSAAERERFYEKWVKERMQAAGDKGIAILITRQPGHVQVGVSEEMKQRQAFTEKDRDDVAKAMLEDLKKNQHDPALSDGIKLVRERLDQHVPAANVVRDRAKFFSAAAVQKADDALRDIHQQTMIDVRVETFESVPADKVQAVEAMSKAERERFIAARVARRLAAAGGEGIEVLITRQPRHVEVETGPRTATKVFKDADRLKLRDLLVSRFRDKEYDAGLSAAVEDLRKTLQTNLGVAVSPPVVKTPPAPMPPVTAKTETPKTEAPKAEAPKTALSEPAPSSGGVKGTATDYREKVVAAGEQKVKSTPLWLWILGIILGLLVLWIIIGVLRALFHPRRHEWYGTPPPGQAAPQGMAPQASAPRPPVGQQGYSPAPPAGGGYAVGGGAYYGSPPAGGGGGGGGGFMSGMLGGMFGGAAGSWMYDSMFRRSAPSAPGGGWSSPPPAHTGQPYRAERPAPAYDNPPAGGITSSGGDFDDAPAAAGAGITSSGGDFDDQPAGSGGGDFGDEANTQQAAGGGGDFGDDTAGSGGGGDFASDSGSAGGGGGDFGSADAGGGGGVFGGASEPTGGGDFDRGGGAADSGGGGGDTGGGGSDGGDF